MSKKLTHFVPDEIIDQIKQVSSIVETVSQHVALKKVGANYKGLCPFHDEKTPSFFVSENKKMFYCFGCGESGNVFTFLMKIQNLTFQESLRYLAKKHGIFIPETPLTPEQKKRISLKQECTEINEAVAGFYNELLLNDSRAKKARQYLEKRRIGADSIKAFSLGFAPEEWTGLEQFLKQKNLNISSAYKTGLLIKRDSGGYYSRFRNRIMFPIRNVSGQVAGFGARVIDGGEPKYINSPESFLYSKRQNLYALDSASRAIQKQDEALVVEGYFDVITLHQAGIKNAVAPLGTALTETQISTLKRYTSNIVMIFDGDDSGQRAMVRCLDPFLNASCSPRYVLLPAGNDPDSFVFTNGAEALREKTEQAGILLDFVIEAAVQKKNLASPRGKIEALDGALEFVRKIPDHLERELYVEKLSRRLEIEKSHILTRLGSRKQTTGGYGDTGNSSEKEKTVLSSQKNAEILILKTIISCPRKTVPVVEAHGILEEFSDPGLREIGRLLCSTYREKGDIGMSPLTDHHENPMFAALFAENEFRHDIKNDALKILEDCTKNIKRRNNKNKIDELKILLKKAEAMRDIAMSRKYEFELNNLVKEKEKILQYKLHN